MLPRTFGTLAGLALGMAVVGGCQKDTPATPTPPAPVHATIVVSSISVTGERAAAGGYTYRVVLHLRETGGAIATVSAVNLTFVNDSGTVVSARYDQPIPATGNMCPANGTADTREFVTTDANTAHAFAQSVQAAVTYTDAAATAGTATGSASIPPLPGLPPVTHTLTGVITDAATGGGIQGARVEALNGANVGKAVTTDASGAYALTGLTAETFRMRASAAGYDSGEQNVTVPDVPRADMALRQTGGPCAYTIDPASQSAGDLGGTFTATITRTSGSCGWQARTSDSTMISFPSATSGGGSGTLTYLVPTWTGLGPRTGTIFIEWSGGSAQLTVRQSAFLPPPCQFRLLPPILTVPLTPAAGQRFSLTIDVSGGPGCDWKAVADDAWIHLEQSSVSGVDNGTILFSVDSSTSSRTGSISISWRYPTPGGSSKTVTQQ